METFSTNKFAGPCALCGERVGAKAGVLTRIAGKIKSVHAECATGEKKEATDSTVSASVDRDEKPSTETKPTTTFDPTSEQNECLALFETGDSMVIEAGAGTGKTATLKLLAESTDRRGQYLAFNRAIVEEAKAKFPANVSCNTAHSLAFRAVGKEYAHRLKAPRMSSDHIARILNVSPIKVRVGDAGYRTLAAGFLAGRVMQAVTRFCQSADDAPERKHFPYLEGIDLPDAQGRRTFANNDEIANAMLPAMRKAWTDLSKKDGELRFGHDHYLKLWQLSDPKIDADFILFDEAQDANPVMAAIVANQRHAQVVYVGDSQQAIYEFTGAVNTLGRLDSDRRVFLTQSFRFGLAVARVANDVLARIEGAELRLVGTASIASVVGLLEREDAILCRTNAAAVSTVLRLLDAGRRPHLVGGGSEVVAFAKAARDLMESGSTSHPELACFDSWEGVQFYVENDAQGGELKLLVKLVDEFGVDTILAALDNMAGEKQADVIVSTAHKAKGREWDAVRLGDDFSKFLTSEDGEPPVAEKRLLYVAVTRARLFLDCSSVEDFFNPRKVVDDDVTKWVDGVES